jgi:hypothetical protein
MTMISAVRITFTAGTAAFVAAICAPAYATVLGADFHPQAVSGTTISRGADGLEHTLMCPPDENVLGGGFTVSAPAGRQLDAVPADVLTSRSTEDATGWIVAVRKSLRPVNGHAGPADLTVQVVCTEGEVTPGG